MSLPRLLLIILTLLCLPGLSSCTRVSTCLADRAQQYDGVEAEQNIYRSGNKHYLKGHRVQLRDSHDVLIDLCGGGSTRVKIKGTDGETVYCPVRYERDATYSYQVLYDWHRQGEWTSTPPPAPLVRTRNIYNVHPYHPVGKAKYNAHALWAYPMAAVSLVAIDIPTGLGHGLYFLCIELPYSLWSWHQKQP